MINIQEVTETNQMISEMNLDVRTITLGISLLDCIDSDLEQAEGKDLPQDYLCGERLSGCRK